MRLYHFTALELLPGIAREGLYRGDVPTSATGGARAVWLTTDPHPGGHGLSKAGPFSPKMREGYRRITGQEAPPDARTIDKGRVRFAVDLDPSDIALRRWTEWAVANGVTRAWRKTLERAGGAKSKTWWLYFDVIPANRLEPIDMATGKPLEGWPDAFTVHE